MHAYLDPAGSPLGQWRRQKKAVTLMSRARRRRVKRTLRRRRGL
jgi:hypothetical protein